MTSLDADREFALGQVPEVRRAAVGALWRLDAALGAVVAGGREPLISQIKLAWWREALEKLDRKKPPAEPILQDLAAHVLPAGVTGAELSTMETGWAVLLSSEPLTSGDLDSYASGRGAALFRFTARLLSVDPGPGLEAGGEAWALVDLARHSNQADAAAALAAASSRKGTPHWPRSLRPLGMLAVLALRNSKLGLERLEPLGAPPRVARMLRHRLTGR